MLPLFLDLTAFHKSACPPYRQIVDLAFPAHETARTLAELPYLPLSLFKHRRLISAPESSICLTLRSKGTKRTPKSRVDLDTTTIELSSQLLRNTLRAVIGEQAYPLLIVDTPADETRNSGLACAMLKIIGPLGQTRAFALQKDLSPDEAGLNLFLAQNKHKPFLVFGFTDVIWEKFLPFCERHRLDLSNAFLLHCGEWKQTAQGYIDNETFRSRFWKATGLTRSVNFYSLAETPGAIFLESADGLFYPPSFADVIIRDPATFKPVPNGTPGLIQILNLIPRSYPGHSLLTEDVGVIEAVGSSAEGWKGKALRFMGRVSDRTAPFALAPLAEDGTQAA